MRLDPEQQTLSLLSIPRDTLVEIPGYGEQKINAAYSYGGPALAIKTVRESFGVKIDHFAVVDFSGFRRLIDSAGGVWLPVDRRYFHRNQGGAGNWSSIDVPAGYQLLNGTKALEFARHRYTDSDYHRAARQQLLLRELRHQLLDTDPVTLFSTLRPAAQAVTTDVDRVGQLRQLAADLLAIPSDRVVRVQLNGKGVSGGAWYFISTPDQRAQAIAIWSDPFAEKSGVRTVAVGQNRRVRPDAQPRLNYVGPQTIVADTEAGPLARGLDSSLIACTPSKRPSGLTWSREGSRAYRQGGHTFVVLTGSIGSAGDALSWMFSDWDTPPILERPSERRTIGGREYELWWEGAALRQVAFRIDGRRVWLTNTLRADLRPRDLLAVATSCRR